MLHGTEGQAKADNIRIGKLSLAGWVARIYSGARYNGIDSYSQGQHVVSVALADVSRHR